MAINLDAVRKESEPVVFEYSEKDVILYALGIGASNEDIDFVYEKNLKVYPTFAVIPAFPTMAWAITKTQVNLAMLLHAGQKITVYREIPTKGKLTTVARITNIYDKVKSALIVVDAETKDESGTSLFNNTASLFIRGAGGFGGDRGSSTTENKPPEGKEPDFHDELVTLKDQNLIYRLSGDTNPLHVDPEFAKLAGFDRPILHGLCTFGFVGRSILRSLCDNDTRTLKSFDVRFTGIVFPGDTIIVEGWKVNSKRYVIQAKTQGGGEVISATAGLK